MTIINTVEGRKMHRCLRLRKVRVRIVDGDLRRGRPFHYLNTEETNSDWINLIGAQTTT